jgi:hypothetical protein
MHGIGYTSFFCNQAGGKLRLYVAVKLEASSSLPTPRLDQPAGLVAKASLWLPFDVERELASLSVLAKKWRAPHGIVRDSLSYKSMV